MKPTGSRCSHSRRRGQCRGRGHMLFATLTAASCGALSAAESGAADHCRSWNRLAPSRGTAAFVALSDDCRALPWSSALAATSAAKKKKKNNKGGGGSTVGGGGFGKQAVGGGGGASSLSLSSSSRPVPFAPVKNKGPTYTFDLGSNIKEHLNPKLLNDPTALSDIRTKLQGGEIVVIRDAFLPDLADAMHRELLSTTAWTVNESYLDDGYHYRHYNVYDRDAYSDLFDRMIRHVLDTDETKNFMSDLSGRDCTGHVVGSPSYYGPGDHSLPHTDHFGQRTVAYVWHLSKNWRPEWGGALYWAQEPLANAYLHASYNTLVLFSVTPLSSHFVTTVSPHSIQEKRLSFNGWWQSSWMPQLTDDLEHRMSTRERRLALTYDQYVAIERILHDPWSPKVEPQERREKLEHLFELHMKESYPDSRSPPVIL